MIFVWSGWGFLTVLVVAAVSIAVGALLQTALAAAGHPELAFLAVSAGLLCAAAANWLLGRHLNTRPGRELLDPRTGERVVLRRRHNLFWIPMQWWSIPVALAALVPLLALRNLH